MTTRSSTAVVRRSLRTRLSTIAGLGVLVFGAHACSRVPLLAPSGSAITLQAPATALSTDAVQVVALVFEGATATSSGTNGTGTNNNNNNATTTAGGGQPVHNGTHVSFTTSLGTIDPADATTVNGKVTVTLNGNGQVGTVTITATSGDAVKTATITLTAPPSGGL